jgi:uncharacterized protein YybS (DUF2232 family)
MDRLDLPSDSSMAAPSAEDEPWIADDETYLETPSTNRSPSQRPLMASGPPPSALGKGPLVMVETAFLASAASLMWLINLYLPPGPLLRILFPLPIVLVYLRWNRRAAWMATLVSGLLLAILIGPPRSLLFVMPYGVLGVQLGWLWRRRASWGIAIGLGGIVMTFGMFFRIWLLSWMAGEDLWGYLIAQITQLLDWLSHWLVKSGLIPLGSVGQPSLQLIQIAAVLMVLFSSCVYLFTVHLAAWLILERLGVPMSPPPRWVQVLLDE